jgi:hypothetical protein
VGAVTGTLFGGVEVAVSRVNGGVGAKETTPPSVGTTPITLSGCQVTPSSNDSHAQVR